jgi:hypothetical protein
LFITSQRDIEIADEPLIESAMPHPPKTLKAIVVAYTPTKIVDDFNSAELSPEFSYSPYY